MGIIFRNGVAYGGDDKELYFDSKNDFPEEGNELNLYVAEDENKIYRWSGEEYIMLGGDTPTITASEDQAIVGDGNSWVEGGPFYMKKDGTEISLEAKFDSTVAKVGTINIRGNSEKSGQKMPVSTTNSSWTQKVPSLTLSEDAIALFQNSYFKVVDSEVCIAEDSMIHIDKFEGISGLPATSETNNAPKIMMHDNIWVAFNPLYGAHPVNPKIEVTGGLYFHSWAEAPNIWKGSISYEPGIDSWTQMQRMSGVSYNGEPANTLASLMENKFGAPTFLLYGGTQPRKSSIGSGSAWQGPAIQFFGDPVFEMTGLSGFKMADLSTFLSDGAAAVRLMDQATIQVTGGSDVKLFQNACFHMFNNAYCLIQSAANSSYAAGLSISYSNNDDEIFLTSRGQYQSNGKDGITGPGGYKFSRIFHNLSFLSGSVDQYGNTDDGIFSFNYSEKTDFDKAAILRIGSNFNADLGSSSNQGATTLKMGANDGRHLYLIEPNSGDSFVKYAPTDNSTIIIDTNAPSYFRCSSQDQTYCSLTPNGKVDITWQPAGDYKKLINAEEYYERVDGKHYKNLEGNSRFVMRGYQDNEEFSSETEKQKKIEFETEHFYPEGTVLADLSNYSTDGILDSQTAEDFLANQYTGGNKRWGCQYDPTNINIQKIISNKTDEKWYHLTVTLDIPTGIYLYTGGQTTDYVAGQFNLINNRQFASLGNLGKQIVSCFGENINFLDTTKIGYVRNSSSGWIYYTGGITNAQVRVWVPDPPAGTQITDGMQYSELPTSYKQAIDKRTSSYVQTSSYTYYKFDNWFPHDSYTNYFISFGRYGSNTTNTYKTVSDFGVRTDKRPKLSIEYTTNLIPNYGSDTSRPLQTKKETPTFQMYDSSNLVMRGNYINEYAELLQEDPIPVTVQTLEEKIEWLKTSPYWDNLQDYISQKGQYYQGITNIAWETREVYSLLQTLPSNWTSSYTNYYQYKEDKFVQNASLGYVSNEEILRKYPRYEINKTYYEKQNVTALFIDYKFEKTSDNEQVTTIDSPVFEMIGTSELRLHNGAVIKAEVENGNTKVTFGNGADQSISFTFQELQALKALLSNSVTSTTINAIESVQTEPQNPTQGTVYIIEGSNE